MITHEEVKRQLHYDPLTGIFTWLVSNNKINKNEGKIAGYINNNGYHLIRINKLHILGHRLAWFYMTGEWPNEFIDHINGIKDDNRFLNLREATRAQNTINHVSKRNPSSGFRGVQKIGKKYVARGCLNAKLQNIGIFDDVFDAALAYQIFIFKNYGDYLPNHE